MSDVGSSRRPLGALLFAALMFGSNCVAIEARKHVQPRAPAARPTPRFCCAPRGAAVAPRTSVPRGGLRPNECPTVDVAVLATIDGKRAEPGDRFEFVTLDTIYVDLRPIRRGTRGAGFIETLSHARGNGHPGYLVLDARYLRLSNGRHVPVSFAPGHEARTPAFVAAGSTDAPGILGYTPLVAATSIYNMLHHGKDAALVRGTRVPLIVGDGLAAGTCRVSWME